MKKFFLSKFLPKFLLSTILLLFMMMASGCGQSGSLYLLPKESSVKKQANK